MTTFSRRAIAALPLLALALAGCSSLPGEAPRSASAAPAPMAATAPALVPTGTSPWGFPVYDIPADPAVRYFVMDNGLKVAILRNETPKNTVAVRFAFDVGWIDQTDAEAGLAHVLEHMAFNGSKAIPEGEMVKLLEREGLAFGADTNASTSFEETQYKLDLPRNDPKLLDTALMLMRETASELTLDPAAIDRERGIIQSETRTRNTFALRRLKDYLDFVAPKTGFSTRFLTANQNENIDTFTAETLRGLYRRYYRPDNAALVVVGDIDPDATETAIRGKFASWTAPAEALPKLDKGPIDLSRPAAARNFVDPGVPVTITIDRFSPYRKPVTTEADFRREMLETLAAGVFNRRLTLIANQPDATILGGGVNSGTFFDRANQGSLTVQAKDTPDSWRSALTIAENESRRLLTHGVTRSELAEQLANMATRYRTAAEQAGARRNPQLAEAIVATVQEESLLTTPATRYALFQKIAAGITPEDVVQAMRPYFAGGEPLIHVATKTPVAGGAEAILAAYREAAAKPVAAPVDAGAIKFGYESFGPAGTIVSDTTVADLDFRQIRFANNVRLNIKKTDFEPGRANYFVRVGSGRLAMPKSLAAEGLYAASVFGLGGTGKHSVDEMQKILAGRQIGYGLAVDEDQIVTAGVTTMADLLAQMQVTAAYVADPGYRPEAAARWKALVPQFYARQMATPAGVAGLKVPTILANGDPRFGYPSPEVLLAVDPDRVKSALAGELGSAPIEISVVGDVDPAKVIDAVARTFGALPARQAELAPLTDARKVSFPGSTAPVTLYHKGAADQGLAQVYWPARDDSDAQATSTLSLLSEVLSLELLEEVREKLGSTYSPNTFVNLSDSFTDYGFVGTSIVIAPKDAEKVFTAVSTIAAKLRNQPISADTIERARRPMLERMTLNRRENGWWLGVLSESQLRDERLDRSRTDVARLKAVTPAMLQAAAKQYLTPARELRIRIVPEAAPAPAAAK